MTDSTRIPAKVTSLHSSGSLKPRQPQVDLFAALSGLVDPFDPVRSEQALWRAVILQALLDAVTQSHKEEAQCYRRQARRWLLDDAKDFEETCYLAGYVPEYVRRRVKQALARDCRWRSVPRPPETARSVDHEKPTGIVKNLSLQARRNFLVRPSLCRAAGVREPLPFTPERTHGAESPGPAHEPRSDI